MADLVQRTVEKIQALLKTDPTMFAHVKLDVETIRKLRRFPLLSEVSLVEVLGFVVTRNTTSRTVTYTVDDGTGLLPCVTFEADDTSRLPATTSTVGDTIKARKVNGAESHAVADRAKSVPLVGGGNAVTATTSSDARAAETDVAVARPVMFAVGMLVRVQGKLSEFRGERQVKIYRIAHETDVDVEALQWLQMTQNARSIYTVVNEQRKREVLELYSKLNVKHV